MLGAVQKSAPHYDNTGHCTDDRDLMCYQNAGGKRTYVRCRASAGNVRLDCGKDDYFNTSPKPGTYLSRHWNTANSSFLYGGGPARPAKPTAVRSAQASMTTLTRAVIRWTKPSHGAVSAYTISRSGVVVWKGRATSWTDTGASVGRDSYWIQAVNAAGTSPWSPAVTATLRTPPAPSRVRASTGAPPTVSWTATSGLIAGFRLYGLPPSGAAIHLSDPSAAARSATDSTFFLFRSWTRYRVCAYNAAGQSCTDQS
jgi:hypothetical protein